MIESQLEMVKNSEWDDLLKPIEEEALNIPTLKEILSSVNKSEEDSVNIDIESSNETATVVSDTDTANSHEEEQSSVEGKLQAIEFPK